MSRNVRLTWVSWVSPQVAGDEEEDDEDDDAQPPRSPI